MIQNLIHEPSEAILLEELEDITHQVPTPDEKMSKELRNKQDIMLIPEHWWSEAKDTLGSEEPGWWYTVSDVIYFKNVERTSRFVVSFSFLVFV